MRGAWKAALVLALVAAGARGWLASRAPRTAHASFPLARDPRVQGVRALRTLPGIGEGLARALVEQRERRGAEPFRWEDVPGLGPVRVAALRARMTELGLPPEPFEQGAARYPAATVEPRPIALALLAALAGCGGTPAGVAPTDAAPAPAPPLEESQPSESQPSESQPSESQPSESQPSESQPSESQPSESQPSESERAVLRVAGAEVHLRTLGSGARGVLCLHGARYSSAEWVELGTLQHVARRGLRALALDWPGSGASPAVTPAPDPAALLAALLEELQLEEVVLVAPSRGGAQAFALLARGEPRVAALLALAPAGSEDFRPAPGSAARLRVLWGEADEVLPLALGEALAARLPGLVLERVPAGSHAWYLRSPERFHAALDGLLDELGWSAR